MRDELIPDALAYLREKGLFPESKDDDSSDMVFGDDFNPDDY